MAEHNDIGALGESMVSKFIEDKGFLVLDRNYNKKWGELDMVAIKDNVLRFIEVKTVQRKSFNGVFPQEINNYRPEDNMHLFKINRLKRAIQSYLIEKRKQNFDWQFDLVCLFLDKDKKIAKIRFMENIIL